MDRLSTVRDRALELWALPGVRAAAIVAGAIVAAKLLELAIQKTLWCSRTGPRPRSTTS